LFMVGITHPRASKGFNHCNQDVLDDIHRSMKGIAQHSIITERPLIAIATISPQMISHCVLVEARGEDDSIHRQTLQITNYPGKIGPLENRGKRTRYSLLCPCDRVPWSLVNPNDIKLLFYYACRTR